MSLAEATRYQQVISFVMLLEPFYVIFFGDKGGRKIPYAVAMFIICAGLVVISIAGVANPKLLLVGVVIVGGFYITNQQFFPVYASECYPTKVRVIIVSWLYLVTRACTIPTNAVIAPKLYETSGFSQYFLCLALVYFVVATLILVLGPKTAGKTLEELNC